MPYETDGAEYVSNNSSDMAIISAVMEAGRTLSVVVWITDRLSHYYRMFQRVCLNPQFHKSIIEYRFLLL